MIVNLTIGSSYKILQHKRRRSFLLTLKEWEGNCKDLMKQLRFLTFTFLLVLSLFQPAGAATYPTHICGVVDAHSRFHEDPKQPFPNRRHARTSIANLNVGEPRTVRLIYFLPNDCPYRAEVVQKMKDDIRTIQNFYAEQLDAHGYGRRTLRVETDAQGEPIVHRVNARHPDSYYLDTTEEIVIGEIEQTFNFHTTNHYLLVVDNSINALGGEYGGQIRGEAGGVEDKAWGYGIVDGGYDWRVAAHELGHAFGLWHDFRDSEYLMSWGPGQNRLSVCHAAFLAVSPYFNPDISTEEGPPPTIELISPRTYPADSQSVPVRLKISDSVGLHWGILFIAGDHTKSPEVKACRGLVGNREVIVEFDYDGVIPSNGSTSLSSPLVHPIYFEAIDTDGDVSRASFVLFSEALQPLTKISGDNQRGLPNTPLPIPFVVEVRDLNEGWGLRGVPVTFTVTAGDGSLSPARTETDRLGRAESTLTLGPRLGDNRVEVSAGGLTVTFTAVAGAPVDIPDANLRAAIEDALDKAPGTPIAPAELVVLTRLEARNSNIKDLTGLERATRLRALDLDENNVRNIAPLKNLTQLTWLLIGGNPISDFTPLSNLNQLEGLSLYRNQTNDLTPLGSLTKLESLWLDNNNISNITPLAGLVNLELLYLRDNEIRDMFPLVKLPMLKELRLDGNPLSYQSIHTHIPALENRGVTVEFDADGTHPPDVNGDGSVDVLDLIVVTSYLGNTGADIAADVSGDGVVDVLDIVLVAGTFEDVATAPSARSHTLETLTNGF